MMQSLRGGVSLVPLIGVRHYLVYRHVNLRSKEEALVPVITRSVQGAEGSICGPGQCPQPRHFRGELPPYTSAVVAQTNASRNVLVCCMHGVRNSDSHLSKDEMENLLKTLVCGG